MADQPVRFTPLGNLDKDSEYKLVGKGNYTDALDIIKQDDSSQVSGTIQPTQRNKHAFSLGSVQAQNKKYRVTVDGDATKKHRLKFLSTKRDVSITQASQSDGSIWFEGTVGSLLYFFNQSSLPGAFQVTVSGNTVEFELVAYDYYQWYLESVGDDDVEVVCIQEAIPTDLAGPLKDIGSYDLLGDLFIFSTTQDNEPTELDVQIAGVGPLSPNPSSPPPNVFSGPLTQLFFNGPHGLQEGQWIRITGSSAAWLNGLFVVNSITSPTDVNIVTDTAWGATHPASSVGPAKVFIHPTGIGEIGVAEKNNSTESWTYTRLLRSVELNLISKNNIQCYSEVDFRRRAVYYTDNYNPPRVFYYYGEYQQDGSLSLPNIYQHGSIGVESALQLTSSSSKVAYVDVVEQIDNGGNLNPGIKFYAIQPFTENGDAGPISSLTPPIIVYNQDDGITLDGVTYSHEIAGIVNDVTTDRKNVIRVYNLTPEVYATADIICMESIQGVLSAGVIHSFSISGSPFYEYTHTGYENIDITVDVGQFGASAAFTQSAVVRAKNISEIDARNVLSNVSTVSDIDLSSWSSTIRHDLVYDSYDEATLKNPGEFQESFVLENDLGLMLNETYRFGIRLNLKGYGWTDYYWVDDVKIDANSINQGNLGDNRRNSGLPDYNLSEGDIAPLVDFENNPDARAYDSITGYVGTYCVNTASPDPNSWLKYFDYSDDKYTPQATYKSPKIVFNIDWDFYKGATLENLQDIVSGVEFGIGDINNSVKASGYGVLGVVNNNFTYKNAPDERIYEYPFHPENVVNLSGAPDHYNALLPNYPIVTTFGGAYEVAEEKRDYVSFYSPEQIVEGDGVLSESSSLISIGSALTYKFLPGESVVFPNGIHGYYSLFHPQGFDNTQTSIKIKEKLFISDEDEQLAFSNGDIYVRRDAADVANPNMDNPSNESVYEYRFRENNLAVFSLESEVPLYQETEIRKQQRGVIYCQAYHDESPNYPLKQNTRYRKIGKTISFESAPPSSLKVEGGDTATSLFYFKQRSLYYYYDTLQTDGVAQEGSVLGLVCQTRVNVKALNPYENDNSKKLYPFQYFWGTWNFTDSSVERSQIERWRAAPNDPTTAPYIRINNTYEKVIDYEWNNLLSLIYYSSFNSLGGGIGGINEKPTRIIWSERKIPNSLVDYYRLILPASYKDLSLSYGEINHHEDVNGELFTLQPRKYQLQYFNTRGTLQGSNEGVEVLIGDASVLSRNGQTLSSYGTNHKWSVVKGSSQGGKDVIYWFNQENGLFMRFGADGTVVLSERNGIRSFSANDTRWTENQYNPALNYGIRCVWDDRFKEAIWTFIGVRDSKGEWGTLPSNELYSEGDTVTGSTFENYPFDGIPDVYVSLSLHFPIPQSEPGVGSDWETYWKKADKDDPEYYSVFTLAFNELSNGFSTFYSHLPKTYLKWKNKFLSSHPTERSEIYEHRYGYDKWYEYEGVWKESEPYLEGVVNPFPDQSKKFVAIQAITDNVPDRIELITKDHESFLVATDFDPEDDAWRTPIKNDILTSQTSDPNDDTESLVGSYMRVKFKFFNGAYNKMNNLVVKVRQRLRRTQS